MAEKDKEKGIWLGETAPVWAEDELRKAWLKDANYEDPDFPDEVTEHRQKAMLALYAIVSSAENREVIWADYRVREAMLSCLYKDFADIVRTIAAGCFVKLSLPRANRKAMLEDTEAIQTLCDCSGTEAPNEVRSRVYLTLANLSMQLRGAEDTEVAGNIIKALVQGTNHRQPLDVRTRVFGALWSVVACAANLQTVCRNLDIRYALAAALAEDQPESVRSNALAVIWTLAGEEANREILWEDEAVRQALPAAIAADQPSSVRVNALNALRCLGVAPELQVLLWSNEEIQPRLLQAISVGQPTDVRASGFNVLTQLSYHHSNAHNMAEIGVRDMLYQAEEDEQLEAGVRTSCGYTAERLEGAELYVYEEPAEASPEDGVQLAEGEGAMDQEIAQAEAASEAAVDPTAPPGAGVLQTGVHERASAGYAG